MFSNKINPLFFDKLKILIIIINVLFKFWYFITGMNKKFIIRILPIIAVISFMIPLFCNAKKSATAKISLSIKAWPLIIWTTDETLSISWTIWWSAIWQFSSGSFRVLDLNWSTEYWTTISATDLLLVSDTTTNRIPANNIWIKKWDGPTTLSGSDNSELKINSDLDEYQQIDLPVRYFYNYAKNWIVWKYWDNPRIKIDIPLEAYAGCTNSSPCRYKWTITYTLYEN